MLDFSPEKECKRCGEMKVLRVTLPKPVLKVWHVWRGFDQGRVGKGKELVAGIDEYWMRQRGLLLSILFYIDVRLGAGVSRRDWILRGGLCGVFYL